MLIVYSPTENLPILEELEKVVVSHVSGCREYADIEETNCIDGSNVYTRGPENTAATSVI